MNLQRFRAQKIAVKYGLILGVLIIILNAILTFIQMTPAAHTMLSYITVPFIILFASLSAYQRMRQTGNIGYAIQSSILTVSISMLLGFGSLFILTFTFIETVKANPVTLHNFAVSGAKDLDVYIRDSVIDATTRSVPVSIVIGIVSGALAASMVKRNK